MYDLEIEIKPSEDNIIEFLQSEFSPKDLLGYHYKRHQVQKNGEGIYLIAWHQDKPIGHFLLMWNGPEEDTSGLYPYPTAYLGAGGTRTAYRRKGVATRIIQRAEKLVKEKGLRNIGLAVGSTDNPEAKKLYEKLGYVDWGQGEFIASWNYKSPEGKTGTESEVCIYMFKELNK